jgi:hypothetical protein
LLCHRAPDLCHRFLGGGRPSMAGYVTVTRATEGATAAGGRSWRCDGRPRGTPLGRSEPTLTMSLCYRCSAETTRTASERRSTWDDSTAR